MKYIVYLLTIVLPAITRRHASLVTRSCFSRTVHPGLALGMFELFGRTGPPILRGPPFWTLKNYI